MTTVVVNSNGDIFADAKMSSGSGESSCYTKKITSCNFDIVVKSKLYKVTAFVLVGLASDTVIEGLTEDGIDVLEFLNSKMINTFENIPMTIICRTEDKRHPILTIKHTYRGGFECKSIRLKKGGIISFGSGSRAINLLAKIVPQRSEIEYISTMILRNLDVASGIGVHTLKFGESDITYIDEDGLDRKLDLMSSIIDSL
ncbi:hypothetical protein TSMG0146 [Halocynthia phage JM-2012]|uniref:hypothetical protein n=1 Tax=Halocynthia phage JM-2012 TaxID=1173297 RepID=UPI00025C696E|nr:hypothetical protein TSMG0146 [Halocynthia phage JM-2012]AFI55429.1 hypothetical protein TSMG0146 [Halocynthia phage JM-2012]